MSTTDGSVPLDGPRLPDPYAIWITGEPPPGSRREAKHHLVAEVKRIIDNLVLLDVDDPATDPEAVASALVSARQLADHLAALPSLRRKGGLAMAGGNDSLLGERSGITGRSNPLAAPLHLSIEGDVTRGWAIYTAAYEGPPNALHGGFVAAAFDDLLGVTQMASGSAGYTGTFTIRMRRPTPLYRRIDYVGHFERAQGRKIWCSAQSFDGDTLLADAEILFIAPRSPLVPPETAFAPPEPR
jgi:hypothetical protein